MLQVVVRVEQKKRGNQVLRQRTSALAGDHHACQLQCFPELSRHTILLARRVLELKAPIRSTDNIYRTDETSASIPRDIQLVRIFNFQQIHLPEYVLLSCYTTFQRDSLDTSLGAGGLVPPRASHHQRRFNIHFGRRLCIFHFSIFLVCNDDLLMKCLCKTGL